MTISGCLAAIYRQTEKCGRGHTDHFLELFVHHERAIHAEFPSTHLALPIGITDNCAGGRTGALLVFGQNQAATPRLDSEHAEEVAADPDSVRSPQFATLPNSHIIRGPGEDTREGLLLSLDLLPDRPSQSSVTSGIQAHSAVAALDPYLRKLLRVLNRQAAQPDGVEQLKDGGIRADSQRQ
jgi:hypothetical protein